MTETKTYSQQADDMWEGRLSEIDRECAKLEHAGMGGMSEWNTLVDEARVLQDAIKDGDAYGNPEGA